MPYLNNRKKANEVSLKGPLIDSGNDLVEIPAALVDGQLKKHKDGSQKIRLLGGPYHDLQVRVIPPYQRLVFTGSGITSAAKSVVVYKLTPPRIKDGPWVYVHDMEDTREYTTDEKYPDGPWGRTNPPGEVNRRWRDHLRFKQADDRKVEELVARRTPTFDELINDDESVAEDE